MAGVLVSEKLHAKRFFISIIQMHPLESYLYSRAVVCVNRAL